MKWRDFLFAWPESRPANICISMMALLMYIRLHATLLPVHSSYSLTGATDIKYEGKGATDNINILDVRFPNKNEGFYFDDCNT